MSRSAKAELRARSQLGRALLLGIVLLSLLASGSGCRRKSRRAAPPPPLPSTVGEPETGLASWYGHPYHGRQTANGEIYDMNTFTAAHRTLPFDTWVRVTNLENQRITNVRINDRGPFIEGRIIDLSRAAAEAIDMIGPGTALVRLEVQPGSAPASASGGRYSVQVGAFLEEQNAAELQAQLVRKFGDVFIVTHNAPEGTYHRVRVGRLASYEEAVRLAQRLRGESEVTAAFVVRLN